MDGSQVPAIVPSQVVPDIQPGTNVIFIRTQTPQRRVFPNYRSREAARLGIAQIIIACVSILLNIVAIALGLDITFIAYGIWCAVLYIIAGAFGIASRTTTRCKVITHMVMSIIAAVAAAVPFSVSLFGATGGYDAYYWYDSHTKHVSIALNILLAVVSLAEIVTAAWASVLGCKVVDGTGVEPQQDVISGETGVRYVVTDDHQLVPQQNHPDGCTSVAQGPAPRPTESLPKYEAKPLLK